MFSVTLKRNPWHILLSRHAQKAIHLILAIRPFRMPISPDLWRQKRKKRSSSGGFSLRHKPGVMLGYYCCLPGSPVTSGSPIMSGSLEDLCNKGSHPPRANVVPSGSPRGQAAPSQSRCALSVLLPALEGPHHSASLADVLCGTQSGTQRNECLLCSPGSSALTPSRRGGSPR